jgi:hypothetical protein
MKRDAILSLVHLRHLRLGAWSSRKIRISCTRSKVRRSRGEVVVRKRADALADTVSVVLRGVVIRLVSTRVEGRMRVGGRGTVNTWNGFLWTGGLPVDWLHTVFELVRRLELPLADEGPDNRDTSNRGGQGDDDGQRRLCRRARAACRRDGGSGARIRGSDSLEFCLLTLGQGAGGRRQRGIVLWGWSGRRRRGSRRGGGR